MEKICVGKIVSTHGIKGEIRIQSTFPYRDKAFRVHSSIFIADQSYRIRSYRVHKNYDMITLEGFTDINQVLSFLRQKVYKDKSELELDASEYLDEDLLGYSVLSDTMGMGVIQEIFWASPTNKVMRVQFPTKEILIPMQLPFLKEICQVQRQILVELIDGM